MGVLEKLGFYLGIGFLISLMVLIFCAPNGLMDYRKLTARQIQLEAEIQMEVRKNRLLEKEIRSLKQDPEYIRHLAKHQHGMAEDDELIFKLKQ